MAWTNDDGLRVKFGTEEGTSGTAGHYGGVDPIHTVEMLVTMTGLGTSAAIQDQHTVLPAGARIERVEVITQTAVTSGGSAVFNVGLQRLDRSTELDYDGLLAALPIASFNAAGERYSADIGATYVGALVGTSLANPGYLTADYDTAAFTAGVVRVRVHYTKVLS